MPQNQQNDLCPHSENGWKIETSTSTSSMEKMAGKSRITFIRFVMLGLWEVNEESLRSYWGAIKEGMRRHVESSDWGGNERLYCFSTIRVTHVGGPHIRLAMLDDVTSGLTGNPLRSKLYTYSITSSRPSWKWRENLHNNIYRTRIGICLCCQQHSGIQSCHGACWLPALSNTYRNLPFLPAASRNPGHKIIVFDG